MTLAESCRTVNGNVFIFFCINWSSSFEVWTCTALFTLVYFNLLQKLCEHSRTVSNEVIWGRLLNKRTNVLPKWTHPVVCGQYFLAGQWGRGGTEFELNKSAYSCSEDPSERAANPFIFPIWSCLNFRAGYLHEGYLGNLNTEVSFKWRLATCSFFLLHYMQRYQDTIRDVNVFWQLCCQYLKPRRKHVRECQCQ